MSRPETTLVCFAVKEEAAPFQLLASGADGVQVVVTGMGAHNAGRAIRAALETHRTARVVTSGFAGGLNPDLPALALLFDADDNWPGDTAAWIQAGLRPAKFLCADKVLATVEAKRAAWRASGADAVEMESEIIRRACREQGVPSATVRIISDAADEPLPLDFGALMTPDNRVDFLKLAGALARSPGRIPALLRFRRRVIEAADKLAQALARAVK
jgi:adenosylhomocysteine nucleosidase